MMTSSELIATIDAIELPTDQLIQLYELINHPPNFVFSSQLDSTLVRHHQVDDILQLQSTYQAALQTQSKLLQIRQQILDAVYQPTQHSKLPKLLSTYSTLNNQLTLLHQLTSTSQPVHSSTINSRSNKCLDQLRRFTTFACKCYFYQYLFLVLLYTFVLQLLHSQVDWIPTAEQVRHIVCICCCNVILCSLLTFKLLPKRTPNKLQLFAAYYISSSVVFLLYYNRQLMVATSAQVFKLVTTCLIQSIFQAPLDDVYVLQIYLLFGVQVATWVCSLFLSSIVSTFIGFMTSLYIIHYASNTNPMFQACWLQIQSQLLDTQPTAFDTSQLVSLIGWNHFSWWSLLYASPSSIFQPVSAWIVEHVQTFTTNLTWFKLVQTLSLLQYYYLQPVTTVILQFIGVTWSILKMVGRLYLQLVHEPMFMQDVKKEVDSIQLMIEKLNQRIN